MDLCKCPIEFFQMNGATQVKFNSSNAADQIKIILIHTRIKDQEGKFSMLNAQCSTVQRRSLYVLRYGVEEQILRNTFFV
jgi:hypothetical protein